MCGIDVNDSKFGESKMTKFAQNSYNSHKILRQRQKHADGTYELSQIIQLVYMHTSYSVMSNITNKSHDMIQSEDLTIFNSLVLYFPFTNSSIIQYAEGLSVHNDVITARVIFQTN